MKSKNKKNLPHVFAFSDDCLCIFDDDEIKFSWHFLSFSFFRKFLKFYSSLHCENLIILKLSKNFLSRIASTIESHVSIHFLTRICSNNARYLLLSQSSFTVFQHGFHFSLFFHESWKSLIQKKNLMSSNKNFYMVLFWVFIQT